MPRYLTLMLAGCSMISACAEVDSSRSRGADDKDMPPELAAALRSGACPYVIEKRSETWILFIRVRHKQSYSCPSGLRRQDAPS